MPQSISPAELGQRLAAARKARGVTQEDAAERIGVSRPTYIATERGSRVARPEEIVALAAMFGRSVHDLVAPRSTVTEFAPQFRITQAIPADRAVVDAAVSEFKEACGDYLWLEDALKAPLPRRSDPDEYPSSRRNPAILAEDIAQMERSRLGLGLSPILDLRGVLEAEAGIRVFVLPIDEFRIAGMFAYTDTLGGCILVNGNHPITRQTWSMAHEYGHYLTSRYHNEITVLVEYERKPRGEQLADSFAAAFLMPAPDVRRRFNDVVQSSGDFCIADLCVTADRYGVSVEAMTRRLERLGCVPSGTWDALAAQSLGSARVRKQAGLAPQAQRRVALPKRFVGLAVQAFQSELITETKLAHLLRCSRVEARETVARMLSSEEIDVAGAGMYPLTLNFSAPIASLNGEEAA